MQTLRAMFPGGITSHFIGITWPTSFTDLARPKYVLWGYVESKVQKMLPANTDGLKSVNLEVYSRDTKGNITTCYSTLSNMTAGMQQITLWSPTKCHIQTLMINMNSHVLGMKVSVLITLFCFALKCYLILKTAEFLARDVSAMKSQTTQTAIKLTIK